VWLFRAPAAKRLKVAPRQVAGKTGLQPPHLCLQVSSGAAPSSPQCDGELMGPRIGAGKSMACFWSETCFSFWPRKFRGMLLFYLCFLEETPYKLQGPTNPTLTYSLIGWRCSSWGIYIRGPSKNNILSYVFRLGVQYSTVIVIAKKHQRNYDNSHESIRIQQYDFTWESIIRFCLIFTIIIWMMGLVTIHDPISYTSNCSYTSNY